MLLANSLSRRHHLKLCSQLGGHSFRCLNEQTCRIQQSTFQNIAARQVALVSRQQFKFAVVQHKSTKLMVPCFNQIINSRCYHAWQSKLTSHVNGLHSSHSNHAMHSFQQDEEVLIYKLTKNRFYQLQFVGFFTYGLALYWLFLAPDILIGALEHDTLNKETAFDLLALLLGAFIMPSSVQYFRRQLVLKMYYNQSRQSYKMVMQRASLRQVTKDVLLQDIKRTSSGKEYALRTKFKVKGQSYFVYPAYFSLPADYNHMMGFETPKD